MKAILAVTIIVLLERSLGGVVDSSVDRSVDRSMDRSMDSSVDNSMDRSMDSSVDRSMDSWVVNSLESSMDGSTQEYDDAEFFCSIVAEKDSSICAKLDSDEYQSQCISRLIIKYIRCVKPDYHHDVLEDIVPFTIERSSKELGHIKITLDEIKCIVDVILDLIKCIVDGELKPDVPFKWDWKVLINCIMANVTKILECLPVYV